ncbi:MAG: CoA pyrophosphatase [Thermoproteota archaeon]|nr:CoA pyrophosphatase [Thermoproteota archaeon]
MLDFDQIRETLGRVLKKDYFTIDNKLPDACKVAGVLVIIHPLNNMPHIVLTKRSCRLKDHAGQISFPGGNFDREDLTPLDTALRETREEIGLDIQRDKIIGGLDSVQTSTSKYIIYPYVAMVERRLDIRANDEVEKILNIPIPNILDILLRYSRAADGNTGSRGIQIRWENEVIWGATAMILKQLFNYFENNRC